MKYGIYAPYWELQWECDVLFYLKKAKKLGFDLLEIPAGGFYKKPDAFFDGLREESEKQQITITAGYGPDIAHNIASDDPQIICNTMAFYEDMFRKMQLAGIRKLGGGLYGYWPVDYAKPFDKKSELKNSIANMKVLADMAASYQISLGMEVLNRFEGYLLNTCEEAMAYVNEVNRENVSVMLDTFHMNIEEDSIPAAIRLAGNRLGHLHVGEANRRPPHNGGRINWQEIGLALKEIGYDGDVVMEPFVLQGGEVGHSIKIWRDMVDPQDKAALDESVAASLVYLKNALESKHDA
ncbi:MAG: TIM barrel protein [Oscillospiraceae bacterium]